MDNTAKIEALKRALVDAEKAFERYKVILSEQFQTCEKLRIEIEELEDAQEEK